MRKLFLLMALIAMTGMASATLLINGDFSLDDGVNSETAPPWQNWWGGGGWNKRETNAGYDSGTNWHWAMGNGGGYGHGVFQDVSVADDGATYKLTVDASLDAWYLNSGYIKIEFWDAGAANLLGAVEIPHFSQPDYDVGVAWANYSITGAAPAGTEVVRAVMGSYGEGGTARFDNAVLTVVPEPATMVLLGLGALVLRRKK